MSTPPEEIPPPWRPGRRKPARFPLRLPRRLRRPFVWLVAAECCLMLALFAFAWHLFQTRPQPSAPISVAGPEQLTAKPSPTAASAPRPSHVQASPTPKPALAMDAVTWSSQLGRINRDDSALQKAEWSLVQAITHAIRNYLEKVVLPAIKRAEEASLNSS